MALTLAQATQLYLDAGWPSDKAIPHELLQCAMDNMDPADPLASVATVTPVATDAQVSADGAAADAEAKQNQVGAQILNDVVKVGGAVLDAAKGGAI